MPRVETILFYIRISERMSPPGPFFYSSHSPPRLHPLPPAPTTKTADRHTRQKGGSQAKQRSHRRPRSHGRTSNALYCTSVCCARVPRYQTVLVSAGPVAEGREENRPPGKNLTSRKTTRKDVMARSTGKAQWSDRLAKGNCGKHGSSSQA